MDRWVVKRRITDLSPDDEKEGIAPDEQTRIPVVQVQSSSHSDHRQTFSMQKKFSKFLYC